MMGPGLLPGTQTALGTMGWLIGGVLLTATLITQALVRLKPQTDFKGLQLRIRSWWVMAGFFWVSVIIHPLAALWVFGLMSFLALKEYFTLIHTRMADHRALLWAYLAIPLQYSLIASGWKAMVLLLIPVYLFLFIPFRLILAGQPAGMVDAMARIHWGLMAFVYCLSYVGFTLAFPVSPQFPEGGRALLVYLVVLTELNDVDRPQELGPTKSRGMG